MEVIWLLRPNILFKKGLIFNDGCGFLSFSNWEKNRSACNYNHWYSFRSGLFLFVSIPLNVIFYYFNYYTFKVYKYSSPHFEKPTGSFIHFYKHAALFLHLKQWCNINEAESLIHLHYAQIKRNPE